MNDTGPTLPRPARRLLDEVHERDVNFDVARQAQHTPETGWRVDDYCQALPSEAPGPPAPDGPWAIACRLLHDYAFADPSIIPAVYYHAGPLAGRDMVLKGRFLFLRFHLGVRIGDVKDCRAAVDGRPVQQWGWNYRTLEGHLEQGQMDYEIWKWLDTGEVEFRIHVVSRRARIANPLVRIGFHAFGRTMQIRFARAALARMSELVRAEVRGGSADPSGQPTRMVDRIVVERRQDTRVPGDGEEPVP